MSSFIQTQVSNGRIATSLPRGLVAVFVGGTSGVGERVMKHLAKNAVAPRIYFIGRSQEAGGRVTSELHALNPEGEYHFIGADISLLRTVDDICRDIKAREQFVNLLFMTAGRTVTPSTGDTHEGLSYTCSVTFYARIRFAVNLLPQLQKAPSLRRVVTVFAATKEGPVDPHNFPARNLPPVRARAHVSSMMTLALESLALEAPDISFVHTSPGPSSSSSSSSSDISPKGGKSKSKGSSTSGKAGKGGGSNGIRRGV